MFRVKQSLVSTDCLKCCIASILHLKKSQVPNFDRLYKDNWFIKVKLWLLERGYKMELSPEPSWGYCIGIVTTNLCDFPDTHAVIYKNGYKVFDPSPYKQRVKKVIGYLKIS
jgi:hypothetical protein